MATSKLKQLAAGASLAVTSMAVTANTALAGEAATGDTSNKILGIDPVTGAMVAGGVAAVALATWVGSTFRFGQRSEATYLPYDPDTIKGQ